MAEGFRFGRFMLDTGNRRLEADGERIELSGRYLDALALLVGNPGQLVSKDRFLADVWSGVPVTDEALTQCVRTLRRQLGDDAASPRFIETVPKHGYRFIAPVEKVEGKAPALAPRSAAQPFASLAMAGTVGGALAGAVGGLVYGFAAASAPTEGVGGLSILLVLLCLTAFVATIGAAGVSIGIAAAACRDRRMPWMMIAGGAGCGLIVGALGKLLGIDLFRLIVGQTPRDITGALEGVLLGGGVGLAAWFAVRQDSLARAGMIGALCGAASGLLLSFAGGRLMLGSLELLARAMPGSRLRLDQLNLLFGGPQFGTLARFASNMAESALFAGGIAVAMTIAAERTELRRR